jgi:DNA-binding XRE family transcriptional regulator
VNTSLIVAQLLCVDLRGHFLYYIYLINARFIPYMTHAQHWPQPVQDSLELIGELIRHARKAAELTIAQVAERANVERKTIARLEQGDPGIRLGLFVTVLWLLDVPLLQGIDIGHRQSTTQIALLLKMLGNSQMRRVRKANKRVNNDF